MRNFPRQTARFMLVLPLVAMLAACGGKAEAPETNPLPHDTYAGPGLFSGESGNLLDGFRSNRGGGDGVSAALGVNAYMWRAALETVSFMPITQADSAGGLIATDWHSNPGSTNERYRLNVLLKGRELRGDGVEVRVFRQKREGGQWADIPVADGTARKLEDTILTKARALRVRDRASE